jgi:adenylate kinase family enzyme
MGILICGLNGAGKSTLGKRLAERLSWQFIDNEDLYFPKTDDRYIYANPRGKEEVIRLLEKRIENDRRFIFAAVKGDYGEKLLSLLDCIAVVDVPKETRLARVRERSLQKFGDRILAGGDLDEKENAWFALVESRPEDYVEKWLATVDRPVIRVDGTLPIEENVEYLASVVTKTRR